MEEDDKKSRGAASGVLQTALDLAGAAAGAPTGASALRRLAPLLAALLLLPVLVLSMLPGILFQEGGDALLGESGVQERLDALEAAVQRAYETGREAVLDEITLDFESAGADELVLDNPDAAAEVDIGQVISLYCAGKEGTEDTEGAELSGEDLERTLLDGLTSLWDYTVEETVEEYPADVWGPGEPPEMVEERVRTYTLVPAGPDVLAEEIFHLTPEQCAIAEAYRENLSAFLEEDT